MSKVINVGSGPNMTRLNDWDTDGITVVACNNVWRGTKKWDHLIYAGDYPSVNEIKKEPHQQLHSRERGMGFKTSYEKCAGMPFKNARLFLGLPMYFGLTYWSIHYMKPKHLAFLGFDMNYTPDADGNTAFYGKGLDMQVRGMPDPF